jgi:Dolichyl-phosphate-mannose-protein mannosyltransferase
VIIFRQSFLLGVLGTYSSSRIKYFAMGIRFHIEQHGLLWIVLCVFGATVIFVNPIRETAMEDDWAYALTVKHFLDTGTYELHDWAAANMPLQAYWGSFFARLFGYSFSSLRVSTLVLVLIGLIAFYYLAREHGLDDIQAGLLTLGFFGSPLVLRFSFNFMTDVPFLMFLVGALFLYTRAIRLHSYPLMFFGSIASSAAILTRQFGIALIAGLFCLWALGKEHRREALFFSVGLILPIMAALWQLSAGAVTPTWAAQNALRLQSLYFANPGAMLMNMLWRLMVILQYLVLFCLPFVFLTFFALAYDIKAKALHSLHNRSIKFDVLVVGLLTVYIMASMAYGRLFKNVSLLMPYVPWNFGFLGDLDQPERGVLTLFTSIGAVLFGWMFVLRYFGSGGLVRLPINERLLDLVTLFLLVQQLIFYKFGDEYLLVFLPFALIVAGRRLGSWISCHRRTTGLACLVMVIACAMWTRGLLEKAEASWSAGEFVRKSGVQSNQVYGSWVWNCYYGAFNDYLAEIDDRELDRNSFTSDFFLWRLERKKQAQFLILDSPIAPADERWNVVTEIPYRSFLLQARRLYAVRRETAP